MTTATLNTRWCGRCEQELPLTEEFFYRDRRATPHKWYAVCKPCRSSRAPRPKEPRPCAYCGVFYTPAATASSKAKFCSKLCQSRGRNRDNEAKRARDRAYRARPEIRELGNERSRQWRTATRTSVGDERWREKRVGWYLKSKYGLTLEQFRELEERQGGRCAICGTDDPSPHERFSVDHCHETERVRGLLCHFCNVALGAFKDDPALLRSALMYLAGA